MNNLINFIYKKASNLVSPPFCEGCKSFLKERLILCKNCFDKISPIVSFNLLVTPKYSVKVFAISDYQEPLKSLILAKMWSNRLASQQLGELIWQMTNLKNHEFDYLIPIPLHWTRFLRRGFNQTEVVATILSSKSSKPVANILKRNKYTKFQSSLDVYKRNENVKNAFKIELKKNIYEGRNLLLVDDLLTSGATIINAAKELIKLKPATISVVVACRVIK